MTGLLYPKSPEISILFFFCVTLVVYLGHGGFHPVGIHLSPNQFLGAVLTSKIEEPQKKTMVGAPVM